LGHLVLAANVTPAPYGVTVIVAVVEIVVTLFEKINLRHPVRKKYLDRKK
jgi:hypothetical protein